MAKSEFERKADQIRSQIEDLRDSLDDILHSYDRLTQSSAELFTKTQKQVKGAARHAQENVGEELGRMGIPWWVPVAAIAVVGIGLAVLNMVRGAPSEESYGELNPQQMAGAMPPFTPPDQP